MNHSHTWKKLIIFIYLKVTLNFSVNMCHFILGFYGSEFLCAPHLDQTLLVSISFLIAASQDSQTTKTKGNKWILSRGSGDHQSHKAWDPEGSPIFTPPYSFGQIFPKNTQIQEYGRRFSHLNDSSHLKPNTLAKTCCKLLEYKTENSRYLLFAMCMKY